MTLKAAQKTSITFYILGTLFFLILLVAGKIIPLIFLTALYLLIAVIYNLIVLAILIIQLIKHNELEAFFSILIILLNIPIALGYGYILIHFS